VNSLRPLLRAQLTLQILRFAQQFAFVAAMVGVWGKQYYADWVVLMSAASFFTLLDFGVQTVTGNQLVACARAAARGELIKRISQATTLYVIFIPVALAIAAVAIFVFHVGGLVTIHAVSARVRDLTLLSLGASFLLGVPLTVLGSVYAAQGSVAKGIDRVSVQVVLQTIAIAICLWARGGPLTTGLAYAAAAALSVAWVLYDLRRRYPDLAGAFNLSRPPPVLRLLSTSVFYVANPFAAAFIQNVPIFFLSSAKGGASLVAVFAISRTLVGLLRQLASQIANAIGVEIIRAHFSDDSHRCGEVYRKATRLVGGIAGLIGGALLGLSGPFIAVWTKGQIASDPFMVAALVVAVCVACPAFLASAVLQTANQPRMLTASFASQAALSCLSAVVAQHLADPRLILVLLGVSEAAASAFILYQARRRFDFLALKEVGVTYGYCLAAGAVSWASTATAGDAVKPHNLLGLVFTGLLAGIPFLATIGLLAVFRRSLFTSLLKV
jgi:O-antigen/teichoic acid export membrane protein